MAGMKRGLECIDDAKDGKDTKRRPSSFVRNEIVEIRIEGRENKPFCIHSKILSAYSEEFKRFFAEFLEEKRQLTVKNLSFEMFDIFVQWLYTTYPEESSYNPLTVAAVDEVDDVSDDEKGDVNKGGAAKTGGKPPGSNMGSKTNQEKFTALIWLRKPASETPDSYAKGLVQVLTKAGSEQTDPSADESIVMPSRKSFSRRHRIFLDLVDLYIFAVRYDVARFFRNAVVLTIQRRVHEWRLLPHYFIVRHALENLNSDAPLCSFLAACCAFYSEKPSKFFRDLPSDFLAEVLRVIAIKDRGQSDKALEHEVGFWCMYHEHRSYDDVEICNDTRDCWLDSHDDLALFQQAQTETEVRTSKTKKRNEQQTTSTNSAKEDKAAPKCAHSLVPKPPASLTVPTNYQH